MAKRRKFERNPPVLHYRKVFVLATEGTTTEPQYFELFNSKTTTITIKWIKGYHSDPDHVLRRMKQYLKDNALKPGDAAWLVIDKDQWTDEQLSRLQAWATTHDQYGLAVSNPCFELWLLLHFEDAAGVTNQRLCKERLKRHLPNYDKHVEAGKLIPGVSEAIDRARRKDNPPCTDWPRTIGTTVYRLVVKLQS
ncbi:MAG: RloB family protein [Desulfobacter sp.]